MDRAKNRLLSPATIGKGKMETMCTNLKYTYGSSFANFYLQSVRLSKLTKSICKLLIINTLPPPPRRDFHLSNTGSLFSLFYQLKHTSKFKFCSHALECYLMMFKTTVFFMGLWYKYKLAVMAQLSKNVRVILPVFIFLSN
jgi:hypothetical protein